MSSQQMGSLRVAIFLECLLYTRSLPYVIILYLIFMTALKIIVNTPALLIKKTGIQRS